MLIGVDKAQKEGKHDLKHNSMIQMGHNLVFLPLPVGDYVVVDDAVQEVITRRKDKLKKMDLLGVMRVSVDTKASMGELYQNLVGQQHARFRDECILAQQNGIKLIILVESAPEVSCLDDVKCWVNWNQLHAYCRRNGIGFGHGMMERIEDYVSHGGQKPPVDGERLHKTMITMSRKYDVRWAFCKPEVTGKAIVYLLNKGREQHV